MKVRLTVTRADCRCGYFTLGQVFEVDDLCPPLCHELWHAAYPYVFALKNGALLDHDQQRAPFFDVECPDGGRVRLHGERIAE